MASHPIVHIEFSAKDLVAAARFYNQLFGWTTEQEPQMNYATFRAEGGPGGGFSPLTENNSPGTVLVYILSADIEADLAKAASLGGKIITHKMEIPGEGWMGVFADPTGNKVGLFTNSRPMPG